LFLEHVTRNVCSVFILGLNISSLNSVQNVQPVCPVYYFGTVKAF
jgi:hypothetical protein